MHAWDGQKRNAEHFQSQMEGRPKLDAGKGESVGRKKGVDTASVFLPLANHEEARSTPGYAVGGALCRAGRRAATGDSAAVVISSPNRNDGGEVPVDVSVKAFLAQILGVSAALLLFPGMIPARINAESGACR
jgi:hypothetical protein